MRMRAAISEHGAFFDLTPGQHDIHRQRGRLFFDEKGKVVAVKLRNVGEGVNLHGIPRDIATEIARRLRKAGYHVVTRPPHFEKVDPRTVYPRWEGNELVEVKTAPTP